MKLQALINVTSYWFCFKYTSGLLGIWREKRFRRGFRGIIKLLSCFQLLALAQNWQRNEF